MILRMEQMHIFLNGKERTLQEMTDVALSAGWQITEVIRKPEGSLFCSIVAIPTSIPPSTASLPPIIQQEITKRSVSPVVDTSNTHYWLHSPNGGGTTTNRSGSTMARLTERLRETISNTFSRAGKSGESGGEEKGKPASAKSANT